MDSSDPNIVVSTLETLVVIELRTACYSQSVRLISEELKMGRFYETETVCFFREMRSSRGVRR